MTVDKNEYGETRKLSASDLYSSPAVNGNKDDDLGRLMSVLYAPTLTLIRHYLQAKNGNRRTLQNCVQEFSEDHAEAFLTAFIIDWVFRMIGVVLAIIIFARGIGLIKF